MNTRARGAGASLCMANALQNAGLNPDQIDYINAHGTSTPIGDLSETLAVKRTFGAHAEKVVVHSTASVAGPLLAAAGGVEAVFTVWAMQQQIAPPTINLLNPDAQCDLDYCANAARDMKIDYA